MIDVIKYFIKRKIEKNPFFSWVIFKNIHRLEFLFPHEQDYFGMKNIFSENFKGDFLDIGGNYGQSTVSFRKLGFKKNKIFIFEPNEYLYSNLKRVKKKYKNTFIYNFGLSNKSETKTLYTPIRKGRTYLALSSFSKSSQDNQIKLQFPEYIKEFFHTKQKCKLKIYDNLNLDIDPKFIKIDVEGYEENVIFGLKKTIKKKKPVLLIEYNQRNFKTIYKFLVKDYDIYSYFLEKKKLFKVSNSDIKKLCAGKITKNVYTKKQNARCIYYIPKQLKLHDN
jgi:FkbM family methyltransferase